MLLLFLLLLFFLLLTHSDLALQYASEGLFLWFNHMVPALFPCIVWSGIMLETDSTSAVTRLFYPILHRFLGLSGQGAFIFLIGFTGGFPLGAKLSAELYKKGELSLSEAEFLLSFCNNLGPAFLLGSLFPALNLSHRALCIAVLYGVPICYGMLRYQVIYHGIPFDTGSLHSAAERKKTDISNALDHALAGGVSSIVMLGAYMIFFQTFRLFFLFAPDNCRNLLTLFTEINSGIKHLQAAGETPNVILWVFTAVTLGGLCCIAQTMHVLHGTGLSIRKYVIHKLIQTFLVFSVSFFCLNVLHIAL